MSRTSIALAAALLAGCSSLPVTRESADQAPPSRMYAPELAGAATAPGDGTIVFLRDWGFFGGGCEHVVYLDQKKAFGIRVNEQVTIHASAGEHFIRIQTDTFLCPTAITSQQTELKAGSTQVYRVQMPSFEGLGVARIQ